ncbi:sporulation YhaL family protein [Bacillus thermotolerans]|nr:sporulation YhaL family protein [Bacillus thermotolerans]
MTLPVWVYVVVAGIILSAIMAVKTSRDEKKVDEEFIEKEGQVYIKRMEREREEKARQKAVR